MWVPPKHVVDLKYRDGNDREYVREVMSTWHHPDCQWRVRVWGADRTPGNRFKWHFIRYYDKELCAPYNTPNEDDDVFEPQTFEDFSSK